MPIVRSHREGSIYRLRDRGVWVAAISLPDGRRRRRQAATRSEALVELRRLQKALTAEAIDASKIRLGDYLERWVNSDHELAPATVRKHESAIRVHLIPRLGHIRLSELRPDDLGVAMDGLIGAGLDPQTVRHVRATLRRSLADAVRDGLVARNAAELSRPPKLRSRERQVLDASHARLLIDSTRGTPNGPLWTLLVTTGLRISEALGLAWSDVHFGGTHEQTITPRADASGSPGVRPGLPGGDALASRGPDNRQGIRRDDRHLGPSAGAEHGATHLSQALVASLTVRHALQRVDGEWQLRPPKTAKGRRTIPLTPLAVEALQQRREDQATDRGATGLDGLVFTTSTGHPIHATNLLPRLREDLAAAGLPKVGLHDLRHSAATVLFSAGVPLPVVSRILGHSTVRITMDIYVGRIPELMGDAAEKMQEAIGG